MLSCLPFVVLSSSLFAQAVQQVPVTVITPETVVATVNGQPFTAGDLERLGAGMTVEMKTLATTQPKAFLEKYALSLALAAEAEKAKLGETPAYRAQLLEARRDILARGMLQEKTASIDISADQVRDRYDKDVELYRQAKVKVIFVSRATFGMVGGSGAAALTRTPAEAKKKIEAALTKAKSGTDFVEVVKEFSDDSDTAAKGGDLAFPIRGNTETVPADIRKALLAAKAGDVAGPFELESGYYLFRVESLGTAPFAEVKDQIEKDLRSAVVEKWLASIRSRTTVSLDHKPFWDAFLKMNAKESPGAPGGAPNTK